MTNKILTLFAALLFFCLQLNAKEPQQQLSYNMKRGIEAMYNNQYKDALDYFNQELIDSPKNAFAYCMIAAVYTSNENYGEALSAANTAVKYKPKKDNSLIGFIYATRARIYVNLEDTTAAINDLTQAIKACPTNYNYYFKRADYYFYTQQYKMSDADYRQMLQSDDSEDRRNALMGLGRNKLRQGNANEALEIFNRVIQLHSDYASAYSWRAETYLELKRYNEAADDLITALKIDNDNKAFYLMRNLEGEQAFILMRLKLKKEQNNEPNSARWYYYEGRLCKSHNRYKEAIEAYQKALKADASLQIDDNIAAVYQNIGDYDRAIYYYNRALENDSTDEAIRFNCMYVYGEQGNRTKAIELASAFIEQSPDISLFYFWRGWWETLDKKYNEAIDDFTMAIFLDSTSTSYNDRGRCYLKTGKTDLANADFKKAIELSNVNNEDHCCALAYLGKTDEAIECTKTLVDEEGMETDSMDYYYSAACIYSILNEKALALQCLERSLQLGFHRFAHIQADMDLDNIRQTEQFKEIVNKYKTLHLQNIQSPASDNLESTDTIVVEVPFFKQGGVTTVNCSINNLPLSFIFDTGASDVSISQVEATFMLKNGYLNSKDIIGKQHYQTADGNISEGTVINLRQINFGGLELNDIRASVVKSQNAPLLLGQSVLQRLGKIEIDNENRIIKITKR